MNRKQKKMLQRICISAALLILVNLIPLPIWAKCIVCAAAYLAVGWDILRKAAKGIKNRQVFDENFLMAVATIGAIVLGEYGEGVAVMLFYQVGELFQSYAVGKSRRNISDLMDIRPDSANVETEDETVEETNPDDVAVGTRALPMRSAQGALDRVRALRRAGKIRTDESVKITFGDGRYLLDRHLSFGADDSYIEFVAEHPIEEE